MEESHVVTSFLEHKSKIAVFRRSARVGAYQGRWAGVSGFMEKGAAPLQEALREINEETGLSDEDVELVATGKMVEVVDKTLNRKWLVHPFRFKVKCPERIKTDWEHTEMKWIDPADLAYLETVPRLAEVWAEVSEETERPS